MTVSNDAIFENLVDKFSQVESDENKNVDEARIDEITTWGDLGWEEPSGAPDLSKGWKVCYVATGDIYDIEDTDEKYVQLVGHDELPVGDSFVYSNDWELIDPEGSKVRVDRREDYHGPEESKTNEEEVKEDETDEKKAVPVCKKCGKKHWPFEKCKAAEGSIDADKEPDTEPEHEKENEAEEVKEKDYKPTAEDIRRRTGTFLDRVSKGKELNSLDILDLKCLLKDALRVGEDLPESEELETNKEEVKEDE